ncbi:putative transposase-associated domain-containing protein, partial [Tanacetum coccineum]
IPTDGPATVEMVNATKDNFDVDALSKSISEDLRWHATRRITDGVLRHPADSQAWRTIDEKFPEIAEDTRNLRLGISADGVDVNTGNRHHSVWPILTVIYNLPPWLCMKRKFINLSVLISGYPGNDIDVFLEPLVDDLHTLFETGVDTYDASTKDNFNLRAVVLWTINDYPALATLCGCPYSGFKCCVVCGKDTNCVRLSASSKQSYVGHRRYLPYNYPFRKQKKAFNGQQEFFQAPIPMTTEQIYNEVKPIENKWGKGKRTNNNASENQEDTRGRGGKIQKQKRNTTEEEGSSSQVNGQNGVYWKKFNIWYRKLKYWRHNPVPHCIDFMHVEKNVAESIVGTLLHVPGKTKDGLNARLDLAELGVKPELFAMQDEDKTTLPPAGYTLTNAEKDIFCETLHNIKVPEGYCSNFSSLVNLKDRKLIGLKSHDYHMLMQEFLPIAIRSIMHPPTRYAIIRRHKQVLKTENPCKRIAFLENEHSKSFAKWLREEVATHSSDSYSTSQISTSEEIDYDSPEPPKSLLKWYHYLSDEYKDNGRFWGSKSGCNESDVKPSWKDIEKAKACMLAKAQASEASSKAKVEACGSKAKLQASTKTLIVKSPGRGSLEVDSDVNLLYDVMFFGPYVMENGQQKKASASICYSHQTKGLLNAYGYGTIKEYLEWNYFPSTDNESTETWKPQTRNTDKDSDDDL